MSITDNELWCFSFVTLFNLQGTRPARLSGGTYAILPRRSAFVKHFFQLFSKFFRCLPPASRPFSRTAYLFYQSCLRLSSTFFASCKVFPPLTPARPPRSRQLAYYTRLPPACQLLFTKFFKKTQTSFCPAAGSLSLLFSSGRRHADGAQTAGFSALHAVYIVYLSYILSIPDPVFLR